MNAEILFQSLSVVGVFGLRRVPFCVSWAYDIWLCSFIFVARDEFVCTSRGHVLLC